MPTSAQIRAARGLLKWTQATLASRAGLSIVTLNMIESETVTPRAGTLKRVAETLSAEGIEFIGTPDTGLGVRFRPGLPSASLPASIA